MIARPVHRPSPIPFSAPTIATSASAVAPTPIRRPLPHAKQKGLPGDSATAKYLGHGALSVQSSLTGRLYRFQGHGDSQTVDGRDLLMLGRLPDLLVR